MVQEEIMLIKEILQEAKSKPVKVFFDMDGVCAEYKSGEVDAIRNNEPNLYLNKRPIKSVLSVMEFLSKSKNIEVCILSNCHFREQATEKILWLKENAPFIKPSNINIIILSEEVYDKDTKNFLKAKYLKNKIGNENVTVYLIEDDPGIIQATNKIYKEVKTNHVSTLVM